MTIKTDKKLVTFDGETMKAGDDDLTLGMAIANVLVMATEGGKMKLFTLGQAAYAANTLEVDEADLTLIKRSVESSNAYNNLVLGQMLVLLEDVKPAKKPE